MSAQIDFADLAKRCRAVAGTEMHDGGGLLMEVAAVLERITPMIEGMPAVIEANRADAIVKTVHNIASVAETVAKDYLHGRKPISTAHGALRMFAASLRESQKPKEEKRGERPLVLQ